MQLIKYGLPTGERMENIVEFEYKNEYAIEKTTGNDRLIISLKKGYVNMMLNLLDKNNNDKYFILYVLIVSRCDNELGRYQIANPLTYDELITFCKKYSDYLETDGRHHLWIMNYDTKDLIVYDHHNVLYAYENLESKIEILNSNGYKKVEKIKFSAPHCHCYNKENDIIENEIIKNNEWLITPLKEQDEYNN